MKKTVLTMSKKEVQREKWELEKSGHLADASWYLDNLLEQLKKGKEVSNVI
jgi:hypothetical protein